MCLLSLCAVGQKRSVFIETGILESIEKTDDPNNIIKSTINLYAPLSLGYYFNNKVFSHSIGYQYQNIPMSLPRWTNTEYDNTHRNTGPNHIHSLRYAFGYEIFNYKQFDLEAFIEPVVGFIPGNRWDQNSPPNDSSMYGELIWYSLPDSTLLYRDKFYKRLVSDVYASIRIGLKFNIQINPRLSISLIPIYGQGIIEYYKVNQWYHDYLKNIKGESIISSNGSHAGILFRLNYNFPEKDEK